MPIIVNNKTLGFSIVLLMALGLFKLVDLNTLKTKVVVSEEPSASHAAVQLEIRALKESGVKVNEPVGLDLKSMQDKLSTLDHAHLNARKHKIDLELREQNLIERFNRHELGSGEILKLRTLAFEKSLITIRLLDQ